MNKIISFVFLLALPFMSFAAGPQVWTVSSRADVLKGDALGVSIDAEGAISVAPKLTEVFKTGQQYIWSSAVDAAGNVYLGTGGDGKVFKVSPGGSGTDLADLAEMNVTAIVIGKAGEVFAATSPDGKVYKIDAGGSAQTYFEPKQKYIWSLALLADGSLAVGTGGEGRIYKVPAANAPPESSLLFDTSESHIISLATDALGNLYAGTDSSGIVMRFGPDGRPFGLLDSPLREIHDIAVASDGSIYVLAVGESASGPKTAAEATPAAMPESKAVTVEKAAAITAEPAAKSRYDLKEAKSAVYRIVPDGGNDLLWASTTVAAFSLDAERDGVLVGTSDKGRVYGIANDGSETLVLQTDANQISTILGSGNSLYATSSNSGSLYHIGPGPGDGGSYESGILDAKSSASWGRIWWRSSGNVTIQTRTGNTEKDDETWSAWSNAGSDQRGIQIASPNARYFQWRALLKTDGKLNEVHVSFAPRNVAPEVTSINILPTNVGLAANPPVQIDPNIELSGMDPVTFGIPNAAVPPRRVYQRGATSLQWTAEDRNGDRLVYDVMYKEVSDSSFKPLRTNITDNFITIDGQSLADGRYVFKIVARDSPSNPTSTALAGERTTEPIDIDNTAPTVTPIGNAQVTAANARVIFDAADAASYITRAEYSINGGDWIPVIADDGISDAPRERYTINIPLTALQEYAITLRVYDVNANAGNARVVFRR